VDDLVTLINLQARTLIESNTGKGVFRIGLDLLQEISISNIKLVMVDIFCLLFIL